MLHGVNAESREQWILFSSCFCEMSPIVTFHGGDMVENSIQLRQTLWGNLNIFCRKIVTNFQGGKEVGLFQTKCFPGSNAQTL